jgi:T5SS/PEP-CTERM-associated repeat protein
MSRSYYLLLWVLLASIVILAQNVCPVVKAAAYYSFTGSFSDGSETQNFLFNLSSNLPSTEPFSLRTWQYSGGTSAAGDFIASGGFDPILSLYDSTPSLIAQNDDIDFGTGQRDSLITWTTPGVPDPIPAGDYRLELVAYNGTLGGRLPHWAVDLIGPVDEMSLTGISSLSGTGASIVSTLKFGTTTRGTATVQIGAGQNLVISSNLVVGKTGTGVLTCSGGAIASGNSSLGYDSGSNGSVTLSGGAQWTPNTVWLGLSGSGEMIIENESWAECFGDAYMSYFSSADSEVTVSGQNSVWIVHGDLEVGDGGTGTLWITNQGQVNSTAIGSAARDVVGDDATAVGTVHVNDGGSLWQTDTLVVGNHGQGIVSISNGGKITTFGNAYIGNYSDGDQSSVTLTGAAPDTTPSTWQITGNLFIAGNESGPSSALESHLTINPGGLVQVAGATTYWESGGWLEIHGGKLKTGSLVKGCGMISWTSGTIELTNSGLLFESGTTNPIFPSTPPIVGAGMSLILSSTNAAHELVVGDTAIGDLWVEAGGTIVSIPAVIIGKHIGADSTLTVSGMDSTFITEGPLYVGGSDSVAGGPALVAVENQGHLIIGGNSTIYGLGRVNVSGVNSHWQAGLITVAPYGGGTGEVNLSNQATIDSGALIIAPTSFYGEVIVNGYTSGVGYRATWNVNGDLTLGWGNADLTIEQSGRMIVAGSAQIRANTPYFSVLTVQSQGELSIGGSLSVESGGSVDLLGGSITTGSFVLQSGGDFYHPDGILTIDGGTFDPGTPGYDIQTYNPVYLPTIKLINNASANLSDTLNVGKFHRGALEIRSGSTLTCRYASIGSIVTSTSVSSVTVTGIDSTWTITGDYACLTIGNQGIGSLMVSDGGHVELTNPIGWCNIGDSKDGEVIVDGKGSRISSISGLDIGYNSVGVLRILNGGLVSDTGSPIEWIGVFGGSQGTVEVSGTAPDGTRSTWATAGRICVGELGLGTLSITQGAMVQCPESIIAAYSGSAGSSVTISGMAPDNKPSEWSLAGSLYVGGTDSAAGDLGTLTVAAGGLVNVGDTLKIWPTGTVELLGSSINCHSFDNSAGGTFTHEDGTLTIDGGTFDPGTPGYTIDGAQASDLPTIKLINNASANLSDPLNVGNINRGALEIRSGSTFTCRYASIGSYVTSTGVSSVIVTGKDSTWTLNDGELDVGRYGGSGKGLLIVSEGGKVELISPSGACDVGYYIDCEGEVIVEGKGSTIACDKCWCVGGGGIGTLRVLYGGSISSTSVSWGNPIGYGEGSQGTVEIIGTAPDGTRSTWTCDSEIETGLEGLGTLSITGGALVSCQYGSIAYYSGSAGSSAIVSGTASNGTPSEWSVNYSLYVGGSYFDPGDLGALTIAAGGLVNVGDTLKVWPPGTVVYQEGNIAAAQIALSGLLTGFGILNAPLSSENGVIETPLPADLLVLNSQLEIAESMALAKLGSGTLQLHGTQTWKESSIFQVVDGLVEYDCSAPVAVEASASLEISNGATLNAGGIIDPFTDTLDSDMHVDVFNLGDFNVIQGEKSVASIFGDGNTTVADGCELAASGIVQASLTIGAGAKVTIRPLASGASLPEFSVSDLPTQAVAEPSGLLLLAFAAAMTAWNFRRKK